jgi:hypothetical protein
VLYEFLIRRVEVLRVLFGMKRNAQAQIIRPAVASRVESIVIPDKERRKK